MSIEHIRSKNIYAVDSTSKHKTNFHRKDSKQPIRFIFWIEFQFERASRRKNVKIWIIMQFRFSSL